MSHRRSIGVQGPLGSRRNGAVSFTEDPTQGWSVGDYPTQAAADQDATGDPTKGADSDSTATADPSSGSEVGEQPYGDPTQGLRLGESPGEDPTA